jgi:hypothetical protein
MHGKDPQIVLGAQRTHRSFGQAQLNRIRDKISPWDSVETPEFPMKVYLDVEAGDHQESLSLCKILASKGKVHIDGDPVGSLWVITSGGYALYDDGFKAAGSEELDRLYGDDLLPPTLQHAPPQ